VRRHQPKNNRYKVYCKRANGDGEVKNSIRDKHPKAIIQGNRAKRYFWSIVQMCCGNAKTEQRSNNGRQLLILGATSELKPLGETKGGDVYDCGSIGRQYLKSFKNNYSE